MYIISTFEFNFKNILIDNTCSVYDLKCCTFFIFNKFIQIYLFPINGSFSGKCQNIEEKL